MKVFKFMLKPFYAFPVLLAIGFLRIVKKGMVVLKIKSRQRKICKINNLIYKLQSIIFNPFRISNGIRPQLCKEPQYSAADLEKYHEIFVQRRQKAKA